METLNWKFTKFGEYCQKCEHEDLDEKESPCAECLDSGGAQLGTPVPVNFKEAES